MACVEISFLGTGCSVLDVDNNFLAWNYWWMEYFFYIYPPPCDVSFHDDSFQITDWTIYHGPLLYHHSHNKIRIISKCVPDLATDCPCGVWCRGWTTCPLYGGTLLELCFKNDCRCVNSVSPRGIMYWVLAFIVYITQVLAIIFRLKCFFNFEIAFLC